MITLLSLTQGLGLLLAVCAGTGAAGLALLFGLARLERDVGPRQPAMTSRQVRYATPSPLRAQTPARGLTG
ncbi:MAG: hypothetical protein M3N98_04760 [Actinomycetota bacterium]|nr:hypothetical protein [Actinomycetota bacterium]